MHPRGQVVRESPILVIPEISDFRTTPRHSRCISVESGEKTVVSNDETEEGITFRFDLRTVDEETLRNH